MSTINDEILRATGGPTINEGLVLWFGRLKDETLNDAERRWAGEQDGATGQSIADRWYSFLRVALFTGSLNDMKLAYWKNAVGPELVVNGGFDADATWTKGTGWTIAGGVAVAAAGAISSLSQGPVALTLAKTYYVRFTIITNTSVGAVGPSIGGASGLAEVDEGHHAEFIVAGAGDTISMDKDATFAGSIDKVSVKEVL